MKILLAGGGSGGPVTPLLAVAEQLKQLNPEVEFLFVGTESGPERQLAEAAGLNFRDIPAAKLRRYLSIQNFLDIPRFGSALIKSWKILNEFKPDLIFSVGGFVAVPLAWAARMRGIKIVIHQQDALPGLANRMVEPFASAITTAFEDGVKHFYSGSGLFKGRSKKIIEWVGNPVRAEFFTSDLPYKSFFNLTEELPILLVIGGGTGASGLNEIVEESLPELVKSHQVVHVTGRGKRVENFVHEYYHQYEFLDKEYPTILKMAHLVISRAGLGSISEMSALGKIAIVVPMPDSHQEANAEVLHRHSAAVVVHQSELENGNLVRIVNAVKFNVERQKTLARNMQSLMPKDAAQKIAQIINKVINE